MTLEASVAKVDLTPEGPVPLAGYVTRKDRLSERVRDRIFARALFLQSNDARACIVSIDLLTMHRKLYDDIHVQIARRGVTGLQCLIHCTHTHSSVGGYWDSPPAIAFCGKFRSEIYDRIVSGTAEAVVRAASDPEPTSFASASTLVPGYNENRRDPATGPVDPEMVVAEVRRNRDGRKLAALVNFAGHPVIAAEKELHALSADYPGALCARLEKDCEVALYLNGAVGGTSIAFPEHMRDIDQHMEFVSEGLLQGFDRAASALRSGDFKKNPALVNQVSFLDAQSDQTLAFPESWVIANRLAGPLAAWLGRYLRRAVESGPVRFHNLRIGDLVLFGHPTDTGVSIGLELKRRARQAGFKRAMVVSHCNEYIGYMHLPADYDLSPAWGDAFMVIYENLMSMLGHGAGDRVMAHEAERLGELARP